MPYNTLVNIIFVISAVGAIILVLRRLPEATGHVQQEKKQAELEEVPKQELREKGLPVQSFPKVKIWSQTLWHKVWQFLLEAKGLKQAPKISYGVKKILNANQTKELKTPIIKDEKYYIDLIKRNPKDLSYYDLLGDYYFDNNFYKDAANVYEYLTEQIPTKPEYWAKLGLAHLYMESFAKAEAGYQKALELDPTNPSRFYNLSLAYRGQSNYRAAVETLEKALDLEPANQKYSDLLFEMRTKAKQAVPVENIHKTQ